MRFAAFDIETSNLRASYGRILCACFKFDDEEGVRTAKALRYRDEPAMLRKIVSWYDQADVISTWNGKRFDLPYVNARLMLRRKEVGLKFPVLDAGKMHIDLLYQSRKLLMASHRLENSSINLGAHTKKYDVPAEDWIRAVGGDKDALDRIVKHCQNDVLLTSEMLEILKPVLVRITR